MPGFDGTGPSEMGSMTGNGRGMCNPSQTANGPAPARGTGYRGAGYGQGLGRGRSFNRGFRSGSGSGRGYGRGLARRGVFPARGGW